MDNKFFEDQRHHHNAAYLDGYEDGMRLNLNEPYEVPEIRITDSVAIQQYRIGMRHAIEDRLS